MLALVEIFSISSMTFRILSLISLLIHFLLSN
uniref:Uncharacterized protein n=1 Tax=Siphoviridae sp. ct3gT1 TaxID=2825323 RepID=A0A8S5UJK2_9CAUD|nr:MAG TPA: hypothetical protein [Siphoviridae sp. ct3gT1]